MYSKTVTEADHVPTLLRNDAMHSTDTLTKAASAIRSLPAVFDQLDRLVADHDDQEAQKLATELRSALGEVLLFATTCTVTHNPTDLLGRSADARVHSVAQQLSGTGVPVGEVPTIPSGVPAWSDVD